MKKWSILLGLLVMFAWACSDDETTTGDTNPFLPIAGLQIPRQELTDAEITIIGKGFSKDCSIKLQRNGGEVYNTKIISVDENSVVFQPASVEAGFYIVILNQDDKSYRIGGINLTTIGLEDEDIEGYGVVGEESSKIYPISISKKIKGESLFGIPNGHVFYGGMMSADSVLYYSSYWTDFVNSKIKNKFTVSAYDFRDNTNVTLQSDLEGMLAMGQVDGQLHIIVRSEDGLKYKLMKWEGGQSFHEVLSFLNSAGNLIMINEGIFIYDAGSKSLVMGGRDLAGDTRKFVWAVDFENPEVREIGGESAINFRLVDCDGVCYVFGEKVTDSNMGTGSTYVLKPEHPAQWFFAEVAQEATWGSAFFRAPTYDSREKVIYGIDDNETIVTYSPADKALTGSKWVNSGLANLFLFK